MPRHVTAIHSEARRPAGTGARPGTRRRVLLALFLFTWVAASCSRSDETALPHAPGAAAPSHRVLVIGWDGATFRTIDPLLAAGRMPNLARLIERGVTSRLESTRIPISSAAWPALTTGTSPGQTGVYSFFEAVPDSLDVRLVSAESVQQPPIWRLLSANGKRSHVFGVPITYPPEEIRGTLAAGMLSPLDSQWATPPEWAATLKERGLVPDLGAWRGRQRLSEARIDKQLALKESALIELLERDGWSLAWFVFKELDVLSHRAYDGGTTGPVPRLLEAIDATLGRLLAVAEREGAPPTDVLVLSDHGFDTYARSFNLHPWMYHEGFSVINGPIESVDVGASDGEGLAERRADIHRRRMEQLELSMTRAIAGPCEGNFGSIRLRVAGRDHGGVVAFEAMAELLDEIEARLRELLTPDYLDPLVKNVWRTADLYPGDHLDLLPDLVFELDERWQCRADLDLRLFANHEPPVPDHDLWGVFVAAGPSFAHGTERTERGLFDVTPLVLHLLGEAVEDEMDGKVPLELLTGAAKERPVRSIARASDQRRMPARRTLDHAPGDSDEVRERLGDIGYTR